MAHAPASSGCWLMSGLSAAATSPRGLSTGLELLTIQWLGYRRACFRSTKVEAPDLLSPNHRIYTAPLLLQTSGQSKSQDTPRFRGGTRLRLSVRGVSQNLSAIFIPLLSFPACIYIFRSLFKCHLFREATSGLAHKSLLFTEHYFTLPNCTVYCIYLLFCLLIFSFPIARRMCVHCLFMILSPFPINTDKVIPDPERTFTS